MDIELIMPDERARSAPDSSRCGVRQNTGIYVTLLVRQADQSRPDQLYLCTEKYEGRVCTGCASSHQFQWLSSLVMSDGERVEQYESFILQALGIHSLNLTVGVPFRSI